MSGAVILHTDLIPVREAAIQMNVPKRTLYHWIRSGRFTAYRVADRIMVHRQDVNEYVMDRAS